MYFSKKILVFVGILLLNLFCFTPNAKANVFLSPTDKYVWQQAGRAIIAYEGDKETLILSPQAKGDLVDFGWIVPIPASPEIQLLKNGIFKSITKITKNEIIPYSTDSSNNDSVIPEKELDVTEVEGKNELYTISTLEGKSVEEIVATIENNGFYLPDEANYLIEEYIDLDWHFVFIKVNITTVEELAGNTTFETYLPPIALSFKSQNIFYPVKLLKVTELLNKTNENQNSEVTLEETEQKIIEGQKDFSSLAFSAQDLPSTLPLDLFIISSRQKTISDFETLYSDQISKDQIKKLGETLDGSSWYETKKDKLFLSQLSGAVSISSLNADLILRNPQEGDTSVLPSDGSQSSYSFLYGLLVFFIVLIGILLSPISLFFILGVVIASLSKTKTARTFGWILEILAFFILLFILAFLIWVPNIGSSPTINYSGISYAPDYSLYFAYSAFALTLIGMLITLILQVKKSRQGNKDSSPKTEGSIAEKIFDDKDEKKEPDSSTPSFAPDKGDEKEIELEENPTKIDEGKSAAVDEPTSPAGGPKTEKPKPKKHYTKKIKIDKL